MEEMRKNKKHHHDDHHNANLPHDIVEEILSRVPVKSLLRFRSVCKQWKTTISDDDRFADAHLRLSRKSPRLRAFLLEDPLTSAQAAAQVVEVSDNQIRVISAAIDPPSELLPPSGVRTLSHCDGLQLIKGAAPNDYVLWNPSNRRYKRLSYPYKQGRRQYIYSGICYEGTGMNNYKVLIGGEEGYAVFNCSSNTWSEMREVENTLFSRYLYSANGASFDGSIYWGSSKTAPATHTYRGVPVDDRCEIVCFEGRDEKLRSVRKFESVRFDLHLLSSPEALYVFRRLKGGNGNIGNEIEVEKMEVGERWSKMKVVRPPDSFRCTWLLPKCWVHQDNILLEAYSGRFILLYDHATQSVKQIHITTTTVTGNMLPPMDNIFLA